MAGPRVAPKWRPPLSLIVFAVLLSVLALPASIVVWFRALDNTSSRFGMIELAALGVATVLTLIVALVFTRTVTGPIEALIERTHEVERGGRAAIRPIEQHGTREIALLSQSILNLAEKLVDRREHVETFAAHVAHELKSPLTAIKGAAELLREAERPGEDMTLEERRRFLDNIIADASRLAALLDRLRDLTRAEAPGAGGPSRMSEIVPRLSGSYPRLNLKLAGEGELPLQLPPEAGVAVLSHLADNAQHHGARHLDIAVRASDGFAEIDVLDDGEGVSHANAEHIFEPFFTTRREQGGTGMGLQIVRSLLAVHGGTIALVPSQQGARFLLRVPQPGPSGLQSR